MRHALLLALTLLAASATSLEAADPPADLRPLAHRVATTVIAPAYRDFAAAAAATVATWESECRAPAPARRPLVARQRELARAWWRIEMVRFGPVGEDFRAERIDFWPERRNATGRGLAELLDPAAPEPTHDHLRTRSAAVQGLPALERLAVDGKAAPTARECAAGRAIAANVAAMAGEIVAGWDAVAVRAATDEAFARELLARLVTDSLTEIRTLIDGKLAPLGKTAEAARPDALQGRRAGIERDALLAPLDGLAALAAALVDGRDEGALVLATLDTARSVAAGLPETIGPLLADPRRRSQVVLLRDALRSVEDVAVTDLPALVGVTVGFNSRDGD